MCDRTFNSEQALIQHSEAKHGKGNMHRGVRMWEDSRDQAGELTTGRTAANYSYEVTSDQYDSDLDVWVCDFCQREFHSSRALEQHLTSGVHEDALYRCEGCSRTFKNLGSLNQHVTMSDCSARSARQVRTLLNDASRQSGMMMLTNHSHHQREAALEGTVYFDGGAQPNPGLGGAGFVLMDDRRDQVARECLGISPYKGVTNNQAEYIGMIMGMIEAKSQGMKRIKVRGDSELVICQMRGEYDVNSDKLTSLNEYANEIERHFSSVTYEWIPRNKNTLADALATQGRSNNVDYEVKLQLRSWPPVCY